MRSIIESEVSKLGQERFGNPNFLPNFDSQIDNSCLPIASESTSSKLFITPAVVGFMGAAVIGLAGCSEQEHIGPERQKTEMNDTKSYRFVSMPDFLNADIGDVRLSPYYRPGQPNSTSPSWRQSLDTVLGEIQSEGASDVLIAGDLVEGEWGQDTDNTGIFGPVETLEQRRNAVREAGAVYYPQGLKRFTDKGLVVFPSLGDHEIGDNPWTLGEVKPGALRAMSQDTKEYILFKGENIDIFKDTFSDYYLKNPDGSHRFEDRPEGQAAGTAYAVRPHSDVQLVSIDVFRRKENGEVIAELDKQQLNWLDDVLSTAKTDGVEWTIVQGHTPIIGPVRSKSSSRLMYVGGQNSELWELMAKHKVDLYFSGEVHDITARRANGITQISHGGLMMAGDVNFLVGQVDGDRMTIVAKRFLNTSVNTKNKKRLWNPNMEQYTPYAQISFPDVEPGQVGKLVLKSDNRAPIVALNELKPLS